MQRFEVMVLGTLKPTPSDVDATLGALTEHLLACMDLIDPSVEFNRATSEIGFVVVVEAEDSLDGLQKASGLIRAAVHGAGVGTGEWPAASDIAETIVFAGAPTVELVEA